MDSPKPGVVSVPGVRGVWMTSADGSVWRHDGESWVRVPPEAVSRAKREAWGKALAEVAASGQPESEGSGQ